MKTPNAQDISEAIFAQLKEHSQKGLTQIYYHDRRFTYLESGPTIPITDEISKSLIRSLVDLDLQLNNKVYLYTCPENFEIYIGRPTPEEILEETADQPENMPEGLIIILD